MGGDRRESNLSKPKRQRDQEYHQHGDAEYGRGADVGRADAGLRDLLREFRFRQLGFVLNELA